MIDSGLCRNACNKRTRRIIRFFKWATENELVPPNVWHAWKAVEGLKRGRSKARETEPVRPVSDADIDALLTHVLPPVAAMIRLQRLTGVSAAVRKCGARRGENTARVGKWGPRRDSGASPGVIVCS